MNRHNPTTPGTNQNLPTHPHQDAEEPGTPINQPEPTPPPNGEDGKDAMIQLQEAAQQGLTPKQHVALCLLAEGESIAGSAKRAGVSRYTIHHWLREDPAFAAAYNAWQHEAITRARGQMLALTGQAVSAVRAALEKGDVKTALTVLKSIGALQKPKPGPTTIAEAKCAQSTQRRKRELKKRQEDFNIGMEELVLP